MTPGTVAAHVFAFELAGDAVSAVQDIADFRLYFAGLLADLDLRY